MGIKSLILTVFLLPFLQTGSETIEFRKVGKVEIGMQADELYGLYPQSALTLVDMRLEGTFSPAFNISQKGKTSLVIELDCDKVWRIQVLSEDYLTDQGIGVGSSYQELRKSHELIEVIAGEGNVAVSTGKNISFLLNAKQLIDSKVDLDKPLRLSNIPGHIKISKILVH